MSTKAFQKRKQDDEHDEVGGDDDVVVAGNEEEEAEGCKDGGRPPRHQHRHDPVILPPITIFSSIDNIGKALREKQKEIIIQQRQQQRRRRHEQEEEDDTKSVIFPSTLVEIQDTHALYGYGGTVVFDPTKMSQQTIQQLNDCEILITEPHVLGKLLKYMKKNQNNKTQKEKGNEGEVDDDNNNASRLTLAKLRWCQSTYAGVDTLFQKEDEQEENEQEEREDSKPQSSNKNSNKNPNFIVTRFAGVFGVPIAEWCIGRIIEYERSFQQSRIDQTNKQWINNTSKVLQYRYLSDLTLCIVGCFGDIAINIARVAKVAFHMNIIGVVRTTKQQDEFEHYKHGKNKQQSSNNHDKKRRKITNEHDDDNDETTTSADSEKCKFEYYDECTTSLTYGIQHCDYIISVLPSTKETRGLFTNEIFEYGNKQKHGGGGKCPVFINVGRGDVIAPSASAVAAPPSSTCTTGGGDTTSLPSSPSSSLPSSSSSYTICNALDNEDLSHVILDVFEHEPLPSNDVLWRHPKVTISPHVSGLTRSSDVPNLIIDNYQRYINGKELKYQVNWNKTY